MKRPKATRAQLLQSRQFYADRVAQLTREIEQLKAAHLNEKQAWPIQKANRELEMRARLTEASAYMIEALAKMIGGPGF